MAGRQSFSSSSMERQTIIIWLRTTHWNPLKLLTSARWVDIRMEQRGYKLHFRWCCRKIFLKNNLSLIKSSLPWGSFFAWDSKPENKEKNMMVQRSYTYSHSIKSMVPSPFFMGLAMKPNGWSFLQHFLSSDSRPCAMPAIAISWIFWNTTWIIFTTLNIYSDNWNTKISHGNYMLSLTFHNRRKFFYK